MATFLSEDGKFNGGEKSLLSGQGQVHIKRPFKISPPFKNVVSIGPTISSRDTGFLHCRSVPSLTCRVWHDS